MAGGNNEVTGNSWTSTRDRWQRAFMGSPFGVGGPRFSASDEGRSCRWVGSGSRLILSAGDGSVRVWRLPYASGDDGTGLTAPEGLRYPIGYTNLYLAAPSFALTFSPSRAFLWDFVSGKSAGRRVDFGCGKPQFHQWVSVCLEEGHLQSPSSLGRVGPQGRERERSYPGSAGLQGSNVANPAISQRRIYRGRSSSAPMRIGSQPEATRWNFREIRKT